MHAIFSVVRTLVILCEMGQLLARYVVMRGDSKTIVKFMTQANKVRIAELAAMVQEFQDLVRDIRGFRVLF